MATENNVNNNVNNQNGQAATQPQTPTQPQQEVVDVVEVPVWVGKAWKIAKKVLKIAVPFATAAAGAFLGFKVGGNKAANRAQVTIDGLSNELAETRLALEAKPDPVPVVDVPFDASVQDTVPVDIVE